MFSNNPKELRAMARQLNAMARTLEMSQDPQKYFEKQVKSKVSGMKHKMHKAKSDMIRQMTGL